MLRRTRFPIFFLNSTTIIHHQKQSLRFCSQISTSSGSSSSSIDSTNPQQQHPSPLMYPSSVLSDQTMNPSYISMRNPHHSPVDPESTDSPAATRISESLKKIKTTTPLSQQFSRKQDEPSLYHEIAPENLRFLYEAEQDEILNSPTTPDGENNLNTAESQHFQPDTPYFSTAAENQSYIDTENIKISAVHSFLGRDGDQSRKVRAREMRDALDQGEGGSEEFGAAIKRFASKKSNEAISTERQLQQLLESGADDAHKANVALEYVSKIQGENLPIRARLVEEVFGLWNRVTQKDLLEKDAQIPLLLAEDRRQGILSSKSSSVESGETNLPQPDIQLPKTFLQPMINLYFHTRRQFTAPTPMTIEHFMTTLHVASNNAANREIMDIASRLMLDTDNFTVMATRMTYATYFDICGINGKMEIALIRFADAKDQLHLDADSGMVRSIVSGLIKNGLLSEALAFLARTKAVEVDVSYLNTILELLSLSSDPMSTFTAFRSMEEAGMLPNSTSFFHLLRACEASGQWDVGTGFVLTHMQKLKIKGDETTLNLLLKGLMLSKETGGLHKYAYQLYFAMKQKGTMQVFEEVEKALPEHVQRRGKKLAIGYKKQQEDLENLNNFGSTTSISSAKKNLDGSNNNDINQEVISSTTVEIEDDDTIEKKEQFNLHHQNNNSTKHQDKEDEEMLRNLAALGKLAPSSSQQQNDSRNTTGAPLSVLCRFCLRKHLGNFDDHDNMKQFLKLKTELRKMKLAMEKYEGNNNQATIELKKNFEIKQEEVMRISRLLKSKLWRHVHKHFYGVFPASTRVVDMNVEGRKEFERKTKERHARRKRLSETPKMMKNRKSFIR